MLVARKTMLGAAVTVALLAIVAMPSFASSDPHNFRVAAHPDRVYQGRSVQIGVDIFHGTPSCGYAVIITVTGPGGVNAHDTLTVNTNHAGNGHAQVSFPSDFSGTASTSAPGHYHISASFACEYTYVTNGASASFQVFAHHRHEGGDAIVDI